jgi:CTP synthase
MGGTMRLGVYLCNVIKGTRADLVYKEDEVSERHRHRYEFNNQYLDRFEEAGMIAAGRNIERDLVEIMELKDHPWFIGVQFHPEYRSTVDNPHPLFVSFIEAAVKHRELKNHALAQ